MNPRTNDRGIERISEEHHYTYHQCERYDTSHSTVAIDHPQGNHIEWNPHCLCAYQPHKLVEKSVVHTIYKKEDGGV